MTGTFVYIKKDYSQNFFKNGWKMRCLWPSEIQRNWTLDMIYWALRHNQNHSNWNLANILAWKTSFIIGLSYFIHLWKSFCLKLALNLSDLQTPHFTTIFQKNLKTILFYINKSACYILVRICEPCRIPTKVILPPLRTELLPFSFQTNFSESGAFLVKWPWQAPGLWILKAPY